MCSASQPSFFPNQLARRSARHFLPRSALPPYPEPTDHTVFASGKWQMNRRSGLRSPSEWRQRVKSSESPRCSRATCPMRVMIRMFRTTYLLSVISTPTLEKREAGGPIRKGTTYMVRPFIAPL